MLPKKKMTYRSPSPFFLSVKCCWSHLPPELQSPIAYRHQEQDRALERERLTPKYNALQRQKGTRFYNRSSWPKYDVNSVQQFTQDQLISFRFDMHDKAKPDLWLQHYFRTREDSNSTVGLYSPCSSVTDIFKKWVVYKMSSNTLTNRHTLTDKQKYLFGCL